MRSGDVRAIEVDGERFAAEYLGRGAFATAYKRRDGRVFLFVRDGTDYSKECLAGCDSNPHLPEVKRHDETYIRGRYFQVYSMPYYRKLTAADGEAWAHYRALAAAREVAVPRYTYERPLSSWGLYLIQDVLDATRGEVPESLTRALQDLMDNAANYGCGMTCEFVRRNLGVGEQGQLVLRDVLFDAERVWRDRQERLRRIVSY